MRRVHFALTLGLVACATAFGTGIAFSETAGAPAAPPAPAPRHGGVMSVTKWHAFETVMAPHGVRVYVYTEEQAPLMVEKATGQATISLPDGKNITMKLGQEVPGDKEPAVYFCPMHTQVVRDKPGECELCGGMKLFKQDRLYGQADLSKVKPEDLSATIHVTGMLGAEKEATFTPAFRAPDRKAEGTQSGEPMQEPGATSTQKGTSPQGR